LICLPLNAESTWYVGVDEDGDGFIGSVDNTLVCSSPGVGYALTAPAITVCNDGDADINPGATEVFDGVDNNCDGNVDEGCTTPTSVGGIDATDVIDPVAAGTTFTLSAVFNSDITTANWYFSSDGDFTNGEVAEITSPGTISASLVTGSFNFDTTNTGVYTIKLEVTNDCGTTNLYYSYAVVYDQTEGFITGGGWINSLSGAYVPDPTLTGQANFGFVSKYKKGKNSGGEVDGNTDFRFEEGDFYFKSSSHDDISLVISGDRKGTYRGIGTVNGVGNHKFLVTIIDGDAEGGDGFDRFRIKIWANNSSSIVMYDNEYGIAENADASTILGGGSIKIHKPKGNSKIEAKAKSEELINTDTFKLVTWPNPSNDYFKVTFKSSNTKDRIEIQVFDLNGRYIYSIQGNANQEYHIGSSLEAGLYFVNVIQGNKSRQVKLVKY
jgi:hypothetical protein